MLGIDKFGCGALESEERRDEYELWLAAQPTCGLCGNLLTVCHIGPCPWGSEERCVWIDDGQFSDYVACPGLDAKTCGWRGICNANC